MVTLNSNIFEGLLPSRINKLNECPVLQPVRRQLTNGRGKVGKIFLIQVLYPPKQTCLSWVAIPNNDNLPANALDLFDWLWKISFRWFSLKSFYLFPLFYFCHACADTNWSLSTSLSGMSLLSQQLQFKFVQSGTFTFTFWDLTKINPSHDCLNKEFIAVSVNVYFYVL